MMIKLTSIMQTSFWFGMNGREMEIIRWNSDFNSRHEKKGGAFMNVQPVVLRDRTTGGLCQGSSLVFLLLCNPFELRANDEALTSFHILEI
jgi:hypothetical protein